MSREFIKYPMCNYTMWFIRYSTVWSFSLTIELAQAECQCQRAASLTLRLASLRVRFKVSGYRVVTSKTKAMALPYTVQHSSQITNVEEGGRPRHTHPVSLSGLLTALPASLDVSDTNPTPYPRPSGSSSVRPSRVAIDSAPRGHAHDGRGRHRPAALRIKGWLSSPSPSC